MAEEKTEAINRRITTELELRALEYISEGVMVVGSGGRVVYVDRAMRRILGWESETVPDLEYADQRIQIGVGRRLSSALELARQEGSWEGDASAVTPDGHAILLQLRIVRLQEGAEQAAMLVVARDVTRERTLERQLLQSQQMELLDNVSIALAHEFRNLLTVILAYTAMLEEPSHQGAIEEAVRGIRNCVDMANELTQRLLSLTRFRGPSAEPVEVQRLIDDVAAVMRKVVPRNVEVLKPENLEIPAITGDRTVLYRALLNLCLNARDAMPQGGTLSLEADVVEVTLEEVRDFGARRPGKYVVLSVTDTGVGMTEDIKRRVFEPFFTTKSGGTGLGLSAVKHGIESLGGWVKVYSESGKGSCFRLYVPAAEAGMPEAEAEAPLPSGAGKVVLIVDDDALALRVMGKCLERAGYRVLSASSGEAAVETFRRKAEEIAAVIVDVVMPFMNGEEVYRHLKEIRQDVRVLAVSGFPPSTARRIFDVEGVPFVSKPYSCAALLRKLDDLLKS